MNSTHEEYEKNIQNQSISTDPEPAITPEVSEPESSVEPVAPVERSAARETAQEHSAPALGVEASPPAYVPAYEEEESIDAPQQGKEYDEGITDRYSQLHGQREMTQTEYAPPSSAGIEYEAAFAAKRAELVSQMEAGQDQGQELER